MENSNLAIGLSGNLDWKG